MSLWNTLRCDCRPDFTYKNYTTFSQHLESKHHRVYELDQIVVPDQRRELARKENQLRVLGAKVRQLQEKVAVARDAASRILDQTRRTHQTELDNLEARMSATRLTYRQVALRVIDRTRRAHQTELDHLSVDRRRAYAASLKDILPVKRENKDLWRIISSSP